jgi:hypothetical protein
MNPHPLFVSFIKAAKKYHGLKVKAGVQEEVN